MTTKEKHSIALSAQLSGADLLADAEAVDRCCNGIGERKEYLCGANKKGYFYHRLNISTAHGDNKVSISALEAYSSVSEM